MANYRNSKIGKKIINYGYDTNKDSDWLIWTDIWKESLKEVLMDYYKLDEISFLEKYDKELTEVIKLSSN